MSETDLLLVFIDRLNSVGVPYMVTGSVAGVLYGEPRVTHDVDIVVALEPRDVQRFAHAYPIDDFYCPPDEIILQETLRAQRGHFNLIHHVSGLKADIYLANRDPLHRWALAERRSIVIDDVTVWFAPPEYVIVRKLEYFREGGSEKHLRDIEAMIRVSSEILRSDVIEQWVLKLGLADQWASVQR